MRHNKFLILLASLMMTFICCGLNSKQINNSSCYHSELYRDNHYNSDINLNNDEGETYYWKAVNSVSEIIDNTPTRLGCKYNGKFYYVTNMEGHGNYSDVKTSNVNLEVETQGGGDFIKTQSNSGYFQMVKISNNWQFAFKVSGTSNNYLAVADQNWWYDGKLKAFYQSQGIPDVSKYQFESGNIKFTLWSDMLALKSNNSNIYTTKFSNGQTYDGATYIYCQAYQLMPKSTVTLDNQNATTPGSESTTAVYKMDMPTITVPTKIGYTFGGYYSETNGAGTQYYDGNGNSTHIYDSTTAKTLYAKWTANTYKVNYNKGTYGTGINSEVSYTYGNEVLTKEAEFTRTGYTQTAWSIKENGSTSDYALNTSYDFGTGITLYPYWLANTYTVTLNADGGTGGDNSVTATYDAAMPSVTLPTKTGYTFGGYYTGEGGTGTQYYTDTGTSAKNWDIANNTTLYAKWTANTYDVTYNNGGHGTAPSAATATYGSNFTVASAITDVDGYTFTGWKDELGNSYTAGSTVTWSKASDTTLTAQWSANTYLVTLDAQGGEGGTVSVTATFDATMPTITLPTKTGYTFGGYYTGEGGTGTQYYTDEGASAKNWDIANNTTLYAKWIANTYTVTLDSQGGTGGSTSVTVAYDAAMPTITTPTKEWHAFLGYFDATSGGNKYYNSDGSSAKAWDKTSNTTLYAQWEYTHVHTPELIEGQAPTCSKDGWNDYYQCTECKKYFSDVECTKEITNLEEWKTGEGKIPATGHDWSDPTFKWSDDYSSCTATEVCEHQGCLEKRTETKNSSWVQVTPPTCTEAETGYYKVTFTDICTDTKQTEIMSKGEPAGHDWGNPTYVWNGSTCTASRECLTCGETETEEASETNGKVTFVTDTQPTCTTSGSGHYEATFDNAAFENQNSDAVVIPAIAHTITKIDGKAPTCTEAGYKECYKCTDCGKYFEEEDCIKEITDYNAWISKGGRGYINPTGEHTTTKISGKAPTCTEAGWNDYYQCTVCKQYFEDEQASKPITNLDEWKIGKGKIEPTGHTTTLVPGKAATCSEAGYREAYYCSTCNKYFEDSTGSKAIEDYETWKTTGDGYIAPLGHEYQFAGFIWDGYTAQAKYVCTHDSSHIEYYVATVTSEITKEATCTEDGIRTYTATYDGHSDTKTEVIPATGHNVSKIPGKAPTCTENGYKDAYYCENCNKYYEDEAMTILIEDYETWKTSGRGVIVAKHNVVLVEGKDATTSEDGYKSCYKCSECGSYFEDEDCTILIGNEEAYNAWKLNEGKINKLPSQGLSGGAVAGIAVGSTAAVGAGGFAVTRLIPKGKRFKIKKIGKKK